MKIHSIEELAKLCEVATNHQYEVVVKLDIIHGPDSFYIQTDQELKNLSTKYKVYAVYINEKYDQNYSIPIVTIFVNGDNINYNPCSTISFDKFIILYNELEFLRNIELV